MNELFAYVVRRDFGFAPNPFGGWCTLATCKAPIRRVASIGDYVIGLGSAEECRRGVLVYAMRVEELLPVGDYWSDPRFRDKRPEVRGSLVQCYGDNIYEPLGDGGFRQHDSHHSLVDGQPDLGNMDDDLSGRQVLVSRRFTYFGGSAPPLPPVTVHPVYGTLRGVTRGYRRNWEPSEQVELIRWLDEEVLGHGTCGDPWRWREAVPARQQRLPLTIWSR